MSRIWGANSSRTRMGMNPRTNGENGGRRFGGFQNGMKSRHLEEVPK